MTMAILLTEHTPVLVQGITGRLARFHTEQMIAYGTNVAGGVTPGRGGQQVHGRPVFDTVRDAVTATGAEASIVFVPPHSAADAIMEAADAGIGYCACITDGIPVQDMIRVKRYLCRCQPAQRMRLTGPNCAGTISPGKALLGIMPGHIYLPGRTGIAGRSGTLGYEAAAQLQQLGLGVSTSVGIGGDPVNGSSFRDMLELFEADGQTDAVLIIGEIGGPQEAEAAAFVREHMSKPVAAYIAGLAAPTGRTMGHAGAIVSAAGESAQEKTEILAAAGVTIAPDPSSLGKTLAATLHTRGAAQATASPAPDGHPGPEAADRPYLGRAAIRPGGQGGPGRHVGIDAYRLRNGSIN
jgi:malate-CoA ligase subunit alpha